MYATLKLLFECYIIVLGRFYYWICSYLIVNSGKSFVKIGSRLQIALFFFLSKFPTTSLPPPAYLMLPNVPTPWLGLVYPNNVSKSLSLYWLFLKKHKNQMHEKTTMGIEWKSKTRGTIYELRIQIQELRAQIHKLRVQIFELQVQIYDLGVQICELEH